MTVVLDLLADGRTAVRPEAADPVFREALRAAGGRHDREARAYVCERGQTLRLVRELTKRGMRPSFSGLLAQALAAHQLDGRTRRRSAARARRAAGTARPAGTLYPFQRRGVSWLAPRERALLADAMGLGKTAVALMALPRGASALIVSPASIKGVWRDECERWRPDLEPVVLRGRTSFCWPRAGELVITNYDILPPLVNHPTGRGEILPPALGAPPSGLAVIADEAHALKTGTARRTRRFRALARATLNANGRVWLLTGTPLLGNPLELWNVLRAASLEIEAFGSWTNFERLFGARKGRWGQLAFGRPHSSVPKRLARVCLRRLREDVLPELPPKTEREIIVNGIDAYTRSLCDEALRACQEAGVDLSEAALSIDLSDDYEVRKRIMPARTALAAAKIPALQELVASYEAAQEPLVVFSAHRAPIDVVAKRKGWTAITGDTPAHRRTERAAAFRAGRHRGLAATIDAGGMGLTFSGGTAKAAHAIFVDLNFTPALNQQAEDRLHRIGQTRGVLITRMVADHPLDQHVTRILVRKQRLIAATLPATAEGG